MRAAPRQTVFRSALLSLTVSSTSVLLVGDARVRDSSLLGSGSSTKTAGGSLAGKESMEASSTRRSRRLLRSSDEAGSLIRILQLTLVPMV